MHSTDSSLGGRRVLASSYSQVQTARVLPGSSPLRAGPPSVTRRLLPGARRSSRSASLSSSAPRAPFFQATARAVTRSHRECFHARLTQWSRQTDRKTGRTPRSAHLEQLPEHPGDLQELVLLALLQRHQGPGRLLRVLGVGEDAPHSLLRLHVAGFLEEPHQRVLVDVLEDVGRSLLAVRRVELVAVDRGADPAAL